MDEVMKRLFDAVIEENYLLTKTITHLLELYDPYKAMVASGEGSHTRNDQLDYLFTLTNRERWDNEPDTNLRTRIATYGDIFYGGGTLDQYRRSITYRHPSISSEQIKMEEPANPYPSADESFTPYTAVGIAYIERPPDQLGYTDSNTTRYYIDGAAPTGNYDWKKFRFADATAFASFQIEIQDIYSDLVSGSDGAAAAIEDDKAYTPFAGIWEGADETYKSGLYPFVDELHDFTIADLLEMEDLYAFPKTNERTITTTSLVTELVEMKPISVHHSTFEIIEP